MSTSLTTELGSLGPRARRWTYPEFERLGQLGFFRHQRVELVAGRIIRVAPQRDVHAATVGYWIVNLIERQLEVYRTPVADKVARHGYRYADQTILAGLSKVNIWGAPNELILVADLLP